MRKIISVVVALAILVCGWFAFSDIFGIGSGNRTVDIKIAEGESASSIISGLKSNGLISSKTMFKLYAKKGERVYKAGLHRLNSSMSYAEILKTLEEIPTQDKESVTIPEGYELRQIADLLAEKGFVNKDIFLREAQIGDFEYSFVKEIPQRENRLEGYLFPDTYNISNDMTEREIIDMMLANFNKKVIQIYEEAQTSYTMDEVVTLASVIEREAAGDEDRGKVASVFSNRLAKGMKLESCATVQYILKERKSVLSNEDTQIDSPYNTYRNSGLPIGPIASPGAESFKAALWPEQTNYLYFMASADGKSTIFSETFEGQLENQRLIQGGN